jgi:hypothetical protein
MAAAQEIFGKINLTREDVHNLQRPLKTEVYSLGFSKYLHLSKPNEKLFRYIKNKKKGHEIMLLTANIQFSNQKFYNFIMQKIAEYGLHINMLKFKTFAEINEETHIWKFSAIQKILPQYKKIEFYENKEENIKYIKGETASLKNILFYIVKNDFINLYP